MLKIEKLMFVIGILGIGALLNLFWICWFSPEMTFPTQALRALWLPNTPLFILFLVVIFLGLQRNRKKLSILIYFTPVFIIGGLMSLTELETIIRYGFSLFLFEPCLLGFLQILLGFLIIYCWFYHQKNISKI